MTGYVVTIRFAVSGEERHAAKVAGKVEAVVAASKRVAVNSDGSVVSTQTLQAGRDGGDRYWHDEDL